MSESDAEFVERVATRWQHSQLEDLTRVIALARKGAEADALRAEVGRLKAELNDRCPVDAMTRGMTPVEAATWHVWGERCSDFEPECLSCRAWAEYDLITALRAENERLGRDYQTARDAHDRLLAENERFKISLSDTVQQIQDQASEIIALRARVEKLEEALRWMADKYDEAMPMRTANFYTPSCTCMRCARDNARAALGDTHE